jgi:hypothetical protein
MGIESLIKKNVTKEYICALIKQFYAYEIIGPMSTVSMTNFLSLLGKFY